MAVAEEPEEQFVVLPGHDWHEVRGEDLVNSTLGQPECGEHDALHHLTLSSPDFRETIDVPRLLQHREE